MGFLEIRLLHVADLHLDWLFERFNRESREKRRMEVLECFRRIVDLALERKVAAVLLAGDIFHGEGIAENTFRFFCHHLERLSEQRIWTLIVPGNHDPLTDSSYWVRRRFSPYVKVFTEPHWTSFTEIPGLEIWGLPFIPEQRSKRIFTDFPDAFTSARRIALVHGQVLEGQAGDDYYPFTADDLSRCRLDYLATGHIHRPREIQWGKTRVVYPGSPIRLTFKETEERGVVLVTVDESGLSAQKLSLKDREYRGTELDLTRLGTEGVYQSLQQWANPELCLKVVLTGVAGEDTEFLTEGLLNQFKSSFFHLEVDDRTILLPSGEMDDRTIKGVFLKKISEQLADPGLNQEERDAVKYAFQYGLAAIKGVGRR